MIVWFPLDESAKSLADEAELMALTDPSLSCSIEDLKSLLNQTSSGEETSEFASDEILANKVDDAAEEIERRRNDIGEGYPFEFDGSILTASQNWPDNATAYVFLLLVSVHGLPRSRHGPRLFEEVVSAALARYLEGESIRFGFPHRNPVPSNPNNAVDYLAEKLGQRRLYTRQVRQSDKDMGVDAVAWKRFGDARPTKLVLLANCSTGANWNSKLGELSLDKWKRMIDFGCDPVRVFAVPWIPSREDWNKIVEYGNMVLDRSRASSLLADWDAATAIRNWCKRRLKDASSG